MILGNLRGGGGGDRQTKGNPNSEDTYKSYAVHIFLTYPSGKTLAYSFYSPSDNRKRPPHNVSAREQY